MRVCACVGIRAVVSLSFDPLEQHPLKCSDCLVKLDHVNHFTGSLGHKKLHPNAVSSSGLNVHDGFAHINTADLQ